MTEHTITVQAGGGSAAECTPADRVTKSLLGYGVIAGPLYVVVALAQAVTRQGFDLGLHQWSLLANGGPGWIQVVNFGLTGLFVIAFAVGLRRELTPGVGARWAPRLIGVFGLSLIAAGIFRADPALGFPAGTPDGPGPVSWHGLVHFAAGGIGFACLAIGCLAIGRRYAAEGRRGWAIFSQLTGVVFLAGFFVVASGAGSRVANVAFTATIILIWGWMSAVAVDRYRRVGRLATSRPAVN